jgi:hypothetical protein
MRQISRWVVYHPKSVIVILSIITLFFLASVPRIGFLSNLEKMLPQDDPVVKEYEEAKDTFGSQSIIMVAIESDTVFKASTLGKLYGMTEEYEELEDQGYLEDVISPANVEIIEGTELALKVGPISKNPLKTEEEVQHFKEKILGEEQLKGSLILEDGSAAAIILKVEPEVADDTDKINELLTSSPRLKPGVPNIGLARLWFDHAK